MSQSWVSVSSLLLPKLNNSSKRGREGAQKSLSVLVAPQKIWCKMEVVELFGCGHFLGEEVISGIQFFFFLYISDSWRKLSVYSSMTVNSRLLNFYGPGKLLKSFGDQQKFLDFYI